ncbi:MAG: ribulokinase [Terrimonas sp.]|nr:ribulokinase [Terrimonas sp.]
MKPTGFVIGVDFGTDSVRSILVNTASGEEKATSVFYYPRWKEGRYCNAAAHQFRQHPQDYLDGLTFTIRECVLQAGPDIARQIKGIGVDTTGSTPVAVDKTGTPLSLLPELAENPNAMFVLWKDHTAAKEAAAINEHAGRFTPNYLQFVGGIYSSEWFWAKLLHILKEDAAIRDKIYTWVEHCDWIPFVLTGGNKASAIKRSVCAAGHKGLWAAAFGGFPPNDFFASLDPLLDGFTDRIQGDILAADQPAGTISKAWAAQLGLPEDVTVAVGAFDAHMGAVGGQVEPYYLSKVMGTSTCDILVAPREDMQQKLVGGICGQVEGSVIPDMIGLEAGQSAFGDAYAWLKQVLDWPLQFMEDPIERERISEKIIPELSKAAALIPPDKNMELAIDWLNGRRTPDADPYLKGALTGLNLATDAPRIFRAIAEATCFGAKAIVERFIQEGVPVKGVIGLGGVAKKSAFIMQMMADVLGMPIRIHKSEQTCALGAAMFAATAAAIFPKVEDAMQTMGSGFEKEYLPDKEKQSIYAKRYETYMTMGSFIADHTLRE